MLRLLTFTILIAAPACAHAAASIETCDAVWTDKARADRQVPVRIRMPEGSTRVPLVLFSHGLGGSLDSGTDWAEAWAQAGIAVINIQHAGSDRGILASVMQGGGLVQAMSPAQLVARVRDVSFVLDEVATRRREGACDLGRIDMNRIGMSGHSFGAITTQAIAGQHFRAAAFNRYADPRVKAAIAFSPSPPVAGGSDAEAFGAIRMPFLSVTGTADTVPITPQISAEDRQRPFRAMPAGDKYLLVLDGANHMEFNGQDMLRNGMRPDPHVRAVTIAVTTAFWRTTLLGDAAAQRWLVAPDGLRAMLKPTDFMSAK
jgi:predicted dienelactone hydrolase